MRRKLARVAAALFAAATVAAGIAVATPAHAADINIDLMVVDAFRCEGQGPYTCPRFNAQIKNNSSFDLPALSNGTGGYYVQVRYPSELTPESRFNCRLVQPGNCVMQFSSGLRANAVAFAKIDFRYADGVSPSALIRFRVVPGTGYTDNYLFNQEGSVAYGAT